MINHNILNTYISFTDNIYTFYEKFFQILFIHIIKIRILSNDYMRIFVLRADVKIVRSKRIFLEISLLSMDKAEVKISFSRLKTDIYSPFYSPPLAKN